MSDRSDRKEELEWEGPIQVKVEADGDYGIGWKSATRPDGNILVPDSTPRSEITMDIVLGDVVKDGIQHKRLFVRISCDGAMGEHSDDQPVTAFRDDEHSIRWVQYMIAYLNSHLPERLRTMALLAVVEAIAKSSEVHGIAKTGWKELAETHAAIVGQKIKDSHGVHSGPDRLFKTKQQYLNFLAAIVKRRRHLYIVRSDGELFGPGKRPLSDLRFEVALKEIPPDDKLWSAKSAKAFARSELVDACEVFKQVREVIDRFIDFDHSLADQQTTSELVACCILSTWFLDAFKVIGFLWPNGEPRSGKTQLLTLIAELGYLGQLILAGSSYASLRDLADYGATLCFDDAENLSDVKRTDPDKRTLLLAGNRRGNSATVKEPDGERGWRTRHVNTFCMRAFSATQLPDRVLGSRSIILPLIRTANSYRANADPLDYDLWPHDRRTLLDNLWSMALANLTDLRDL